MRTGKAYNIHKIYKMWYALSLKYRTGMRWVCVCCGVLRRCFSESFSSGVPTTGFSRTAGEVSDERIGQIHKFPARGNIP